jgi:hypothetical protein
MNLSLIFTILGVGVAVLLLAPFFPCFFYCLFTKAKMKINLEFYHASLPEEENDDDLDIDEAWSEMFKGKGGDL